MTDRRLVRRVTLRLVPFLIVCYFCAYLDRINVGVAALQMNKDLGLSAAMFGLGAGLFFVTYFIFEVPSNLLMRRVGARRWIARIMITWAIVSAATSLVTGPASFYVVRLLLGAAEAGFFPAVLLYLSEWIPARDRPRIFAYFLVALPLAGTVGSPLSGLILKLDGGWGLHGWQWLFLLEALPVLLLAPLVYVLLPDRPADARWLSDDDRAQLERRLTADADTSTGRGRAPGMAALRDPRLAAGAGLHLCANLAIYGLSFFLPQIIKTFAVSDTSASLLAAVPYVFGAAGMLFGGFRARHADGSRRGSLVLPFAIGAVGFLLAGALHNPYLLLLAICVAAFGAFGYAPGFWSLPSSFLTGTTLAVAIAAVNAIGNLGGFLGPYSIGALREATGGFSVGSYVSGGLLVLAALLAVPATATGLPRRTDAGATADVEGAEAS